MVVHPPLGANICLIQDATFMMPPKCRLHDVSKMPPSDHTFQNLEYRRDKDLHNQFTGYQSGTSTKAPLDSIRLPENSKPGDTSCTGSRNPLWGIGKNRLNKLQSCRLELAGESQSSSALVRWVRARFSPVAVVSFCDSFSLEWMLMETSMEKESPSMLNAQLSGIWTRSS